MSSRGSFWIQTLSPDCIDAAVQTSRNLYQYFAADCEILDFSHGQGHREGNGVTLAIGYVHELDESFRPVQVKRDGISIDRETGLSWTRRHEAGMGAIFLSPLPDDRLELVIWGADQGGLCSANRLVPLLTGVGQPDFILTGKTCAWQGMAGTLAMGSFTNDWKASNAAYLR